MTMIREGPSTVSTVLLSLVIFVFFTVAKARLLQGVICSSSCGDIKNISYPFHLKSDPPGCGDPDYELSCENSKTIMEFNSGKYYVKQISYTERTIRLVDVNIANGNCSLPYKSLAVDEIGDDDRYSGLRTWIQSFVSFVNCSRDINDSAYKRVDCLSGNDSHVYVAFNKISVSDLQPSCFWVSTVPTSFEFETNASYETIMRWMQAGFQLEWSVDCRDCLAAGSQCGLAGECTNRTMESFKSYAVPSGSEYLKKLVEIFSALSSVFGSLWLVVTLIVRCILIPPVIIVFLIHQCRTRGKSEDNVEIFLRNQQSFMPKRYSYTDLIALTNHFKDKLGEGGFGSVYKGQLPGGFLIAVKMLGNSKFSAEEFINEVSTIGRIHHVNIVQLVGFCSEGSHRALVYEYMPNGSLDKHIFSKEGRPRSFSWQKLHDIALGTARGIEYLHVGCDVSIIHFDIKPHNVLLDYNFSPKIADFGLAKFCPKEDDFISVSNTRGTIGYIAPELISRNFGSVSCKSDVYSFGMLLLEMAGGRRNADRMAERSSKLYFPSWAYERLNQGGDLELGNMTDIEATIARKLCVIGLWCIQMKPSDRPSMTKVVEMLEGNMEDLQMPPDPLSYPPHHTPIRETRSESETSTEWLESESDEECPQNDGNN